MDWIYERLDKLVKNREMTEEEARQEYIKCKKAQVEEYMNECLHDERMIEILKIIHIAQRRLSHRKLQKLRAESEVQK